MKLTRFRLNYLFTIDLGAGRFFWRNPPWNHIEKIGLEAGGVQDDREYGTRYWIINIDGRKYRRGRLVFFAIHGRWPFPCLDHANRNALDDRSSNLREATVEENNWNHGPHKRRVPLPMGVRTIKNSSRYEARITFKKTQIHLGAFATPEEAAAIYQAKRKELYGRFA